jgi:hypothetical protein
LSNFTLGNFCLIYYFLFGSKKYLNINL